MLTSALRGPRGQGTGGATGKRRAAGIWANCRSFCPPLRGSSPSVRCRYSPVLLRCQVCGPGAEGLLSELPLQVGRDFRGGVGHGQGVPF